MDSSQNPEIEKMNKVLTTKCACSNVQSSWNLDNEVEGPIGAVETSDASSSPAGAPYATFAVDAKTVAVGAFLEALG